jgi:tRNA-modifying protein YgfZ
MSFACWFFSQPIDVLRVRGADRARFLNGQMTCNVAALKSGAGAYGFFTTSKGKIESDATVLAHDESLDLILPAGLGATIATRLAKYIIVDRVTVESAALQRLTIFGADTVALLRQLGLEPSAAAWDHHEIAHAGSSATLIRERDLAGAPRFTLIAENGDFWSEALRSAGADANGRASFEIARIEQGEPLFGVDFGPDHFPQETGREDAVSYNKGCYLGQEIVARIHFRGGVKRILRAVAFEVSEGENESIPTIGAQIRLEGQEVGKLSSVAPSTRLGCLLGLAIVHVKAEPGAALEVVDADGTCFRARLLTLPIGELV